MLSQKLCNTSVSRIFCKLVCVFITFSFKQKLEKLLLANNRQTQYVLKDPVCHANILTGCDLYIKKILIAQVSACTC